MEYIKRIIEDKIQSSLNVIGGIQIEGPKACGKSTTAVKFAKTVIKLQDPVVFAKYRSLATISKEQLLEGEKPILFDEWQKIPELWDFIRLDIDDNNGISGQYILTGSAKPIGDKKAHSGTGRIGRLKMRPLSLFESGHSTGSISLQSLFDKKEISFLGDSKLTVLDLIELVCRGGWPVSVKYSFKKAMEYLKFYYSGLIETDVTDVDGIKRNPIRASNILKSYARNISTLAEYKTIQNDLEKVGFGVDEKTLASYITAFEKLFVIENIEAWTPSLRSASKVRTSPKKQFVDPSIAVIALGVTSNELYDDMKTFGFFFESLASRDLRVYIESMNGTLYHYRDSSGLEIDNILKLDDERWAAVEIKVGGEKIDEAAKNLIQLANKVNKDMLKPSFLMIVYGGIHAYRRADGVYVVPLGCLKN